MDCTGQVEKTQTPIEAALDNLKNSIGRTKEVASKFESILSSVLTQPEPTTDKEEKTSAQTSLGTRLFSMNDDVVGIESYLNSLQNRIQL